MLAMLIYSLTVELGAEPQVFIVTWPPAALAP